MSTPLDVLPPTTHDVGANYDCRDCIEEPSSPELLSRGRSPPTVIRDTDSDYAPPSLLPLSTPSTGSKSPKRARRWFDDDDGTAAESELQLKRSKLHDANHNRRRRAELLDFSKQHRTAVDKTQCIRQLPDKFRYLLLRPQRFSKSSFLSTLTDYYNIQGVDNFGLRFGSLAVVTQDPDSTPQHSQHLCLCFNLSTISVNVDTMDITSDLPSLIRHVLVMFLIEYAKELQLSDPAGFLRYRDEHMFAKVFGLVKAQGYTLFVGIDDYDAPVRKRSVAHLTEPLDHDTFASVSDIVRLLDIHFWRPLLAGADVIAKLFVTGTLAVKYPALDELHFDSIPGLQLSCGFTEQEILDFSRSVLHSTPTVSELQRSCGGYIFPAAEVDRAAAQPLLHPEFAMAQIYLLYPELPSADDPAFRILSDILKLLPEMSDVPGAVSRAALIDLLAAGAVQVDETNDETNAGFDSTRVAWNDLYHAGALTYDSQLVNTLRITNTGALSVIHAAVDTAFAAWHNLDLKLCFRTLSARFIMSGEPESFVGLFSQVLCDLGRASFGRKHEPTMHGVLELVMRNKHTTGLKMADPIIFPVPGNLVRVTGQLANVTHIWEPKTLTLQGMWRAANPNEDTSTVEALRTLHEEILKDDEEELLARPCTLWSSSLQAMEMRLVGDCFDPQPEYPQFLAVGGARVLLRQRPSMPIPNKSA
ncbi:hypothetical protein B0H15DRAFT_834534 [Mycena belliarum]|uniref:AAA-ATPase-like domain-containing protein n=1 Tax=Mycena belliarum TaxID=1033014 RepID=A0AAD6U6E0_9AGAR|nr:hypothetical protein B0H15DRAFT_834534 [Mycena belliae]